MAAMANGYGHTGKPRALVHHHPSNFYAFFSTDAGRMRPRSVLSHGRPKPVIRSNPGMTTDEMIEQFRKKYPLYCRSIFAPWHPHWFFDEYTWEYHGGEFMYSLLSKMQKQNEKDVIQFVDKWNHANRVQWGCFHIPDLTVTTAFDQADKDLYGEEFLYWALCHIKNKWAMMLARQELDGAGADLRSPQSPESVMGRPTALPFIPRHDVPPLWSPPNIFCPPVAAIGQRPPDGFVPAFVQLPPHLRNGMPIPFERPPDLAVFPIPEMISPVQLHSPFQPDMGDPNLRGFDRDFDRGRGRGHRGRRDSFANGQNDHLRNSRGGFKGRGDYDNRRRKTNEMTPASFKIAKGRNSSAHELVMEPGYSPQDARAVKDGTQQDRWFATSPEEKAKRHVNGGSPTANTWRIKTVNTNSPPRGKQSNTNISEGDYGAGRHGRAMTKISEETAARGRGSPKSKRAASVRGKKHTGNKSDEPVVEAQHHRLDSREWPILEPSHASAGAVEDVSAVRKEVPSDAGEREPVKMASEDGAIKDTASKDLKDLTSKDVASKEAWTRGVSSKKVLTEEIPAKNATSKESIAKAVTHKDAFNEAPGKSLSKDVASKATSNGVSGKESNKPSQGPADAVAEGQPTSQCAKTPDEPNTIAPFEAQGRTVQSAPADKLVFESPVQEPGTPNEDVSLLKLSQSIDLGPRTNEVTTQYVDVPEKTTNISTPMSAMPLKYPRVEQELENWHKQFQSTWSRIEQLPDKRRQPWQDELNDIHKTFETLERRYDEAQIKVAEAEKIGKKTARKTQRMKIMKAVQQHKETAVNLMLLDGRLQRAIAFPPPPSPPASYPKLDMASARLSLQTEHSDCWPLPVRKRRSRSSSSSTVERSRADFTEPTPAEKDRMISITNIDDVLAEMQRAQTDRDAGSPLVLNVSDSIGARSLPQIPSLLMPKPSSPTKKITYAAVAAMKSNEPSKKLDLRGDKSDASMEWAVEPDGEWSRDQMGVV